MRTLIATVILISVVCARAIDPAAPVIRVSGESVIAWRDNGVPQGQWGGSSYYQHASHRWESDGWRNVVLVEISSGWMRDGQRQAELIEGAWIEVTPLIEIPDPPEQFWDPENLAPIVDLTDGSAVGIGRIVIDSDTGAVLASTDSMSPQRARAEQLEQLRTLAAEIKELRGKVAEVDDLRERMRGVEDTVRDLRPVDPGPGGGRP